MKILTITLFTILASNVSAATVFCKPSSSSILYGVRFDANSKTVSNVSSSTGGYGSLELKQCQTTSDKRKTTCTRTYNRNEDGKAVTHTVRIFVGNPLSTSYVERGLKIPGTAEVRGEILNYCDVQ